MLQNISIRFDPVEDRLALTITARAEGGAVQEHRLHLTRRICLAWRPDLQTMLDRSAQLPPRLGPEARAAVSKTHHQAMASQADLRTSPTVADPAGQAVKHALVTRINCGQRRHDGLWVLRFDLFSGPAVSLVLEGKTLHGFVDGVVGQMQASGWDLPPLPVESQAGPSDEPGTHLH